MKLEQKIGVIGNGFVGGGRGNLDFHQMLVVIMVKYMIKIQINQHMD